MPSEPLPDPAIRLVVAEPVALLRTGYRAALAAGPDLHVVGEAGDASTLGTLVRRLIPAVAIINPAVAGAGADPCAVVRAVVQAGPTVRVLVVADGQEPAPLVRAGAAGVLPTDVASATLVAAVRAVAADMRVFSPQIVAGLLAPEGDQPAPALAILPGTLTDREREVLVRLGRGLTNAEIADLLRVSETTVKTHVAHVLRKLRLRDRAQAVVLAYESGLIRPGDAPVGTDATG